MPHLRVRHWLFGEGFLRTIVYIDGFNLYYAIRSSGFKWLNILKLAERVLHENHIITNVKYYTAHVSGAADPGQPHRQHIYISALKTVPQIEIFFGKFLAKNVWRPLVNLPIANRDILVNGQKINLPPGDYKVIPDLSRENSRKENMCVGSYPLEWEKHNNRKCRVAEALRAEVHWMEEKGSDVNLSCHLVNDAWAGRFEAAAVLSNDSDLIEPIKIVNQELKKPVILLCPVDTPHIGLSNVATSVRHIKHADLKSSLFPDTIPGTKIVKPLTW